MLSSELSTVEETYLVGEWVHGGMLYPQKTWFNGVSTISCSVVKLIPGATLSVTSQRQDSVQYCCVLSDGVDLSQLTAG